MKLSTLEFFFSLFLFESLHAFHYEPIFIIDGLQYYSQLELPKVVFGSESVAFDCHGKGPYVGVSDGRILKWQEAIKDWIEFAVTSPYRDKKLCDGSSNKNDESLCGRPLGLKFNAATCDLYVADAYFGLVLVGPGGGVAKQLATSAEGVPFTFTNALDVDTQTGAVYFTDSSTLFQRRLWPLIIISGDRSGRLLKYDPNTQRVQVLLKGLAFPNGVALSKDNSFLLLAESTTLRILKIQIAATTTTYIENFAKLPRSPDNIKRNSKGEFWVAMNSGREKVQKLANKTESTLPHWATDPVAVKFDEEGKVLEVLDGDYGQELNSVSEVEEHEENLWIGSAVKPYVGVVNYVARI